MLAATRADGFLTEITPSNLVDGETVFMSCPAISFDFISCQVFHIWGVDSRSSHWLLNIRTCAQMLRISK